MGKCYRFGQGSKRTQRKDRKRTKDTEWELGEEEKKGGKLATLQLMQTVPRTEQHKLAETQRTTGRR